MVVFTYTLTGVSLIMLKLYWMRSLVRIPAQMDLASKMRLFGITNREDAPINAMQVNTIQFSYTAILPTIAFMVTELENVRGTKKRNHMKKCVDAEGHTNWTIHSAGRLYTYGEDSHMTPSDVWGDISHLHQTDPERNGYATQKPAALLERIILASSDENDLVLDCFCGSGVTPAVAERLNRRWIACDQSELALKLTRDRMLTFELVRPFVMQRLEYDAK